MITNSERSTALCPTRWLMQYGLGLRTVTRSRPLDLGSFVHAGLDSLWSDKPQEWLDNVAALRDRELAKWREALESTEVSIENIVPEDGDHVINQAFDDASTILLAYLNHWFREFKRFKVLMNETKIEARVRTAKGNKSRRTTYGGKVDKVVEYNGKTYIVEHKTTSRPLDEWVTMNARSPQVRGYAWAIQESRGVIIDGVIWDLLQSKPPKRPEALKVLKSGTGLAKTAGLPWTTAEAFLAAIQVLPAPHNTLAAADWYAETYQALVARDEAGFWFRREIELFSPGEIDRVEREIYVASTQIRRWKEQTSKANIEIREAEPARRPELIEGHLRALAGDFPRESGVCWQYHRLCPYANLCATLSQEDAQRFRVTESETGHEELEEDSSND